MFTTYSPPIALQVASTQIPEAAVAVTMTLANTGDAVMNQLLLHPGKLGTIAVHLENRSDRPLRWSLEVKGDFPVAWCNWPSDPPALPPGQSLDSAVGFQVPGDFFEHSRAISRDRPQLQINYQSEVCIYLQDNDESSVGDARQLVGYQVFTLLVRPASSYLNFLPALYREVDFVGRFLAIIEATFDPAVQTLDQQWAYLDPLTAPEALLPFLAHWVGWTTDTRWTVQQQRRLIRNAVTLYRWHGTRHGLRFYLHLYTGLPLDEHLTEESAKHISIEEVFNDGFVMGDTAIGQTSMMGGGKPYHFIVRLRCDRTIQINEGLIRSIIEQQKPAFCTYDLHILTDP